MGLIGRAFDERFAPNWLSYVAQSAVATVAVLVALVALRQVNLLVAASLAATTFTIFTMPSSVTASTRNVVGGHMIGLAVGSLFALIPVEPGYIQDVVYALAVGTAMFVMAVTNTEHPPAAGTALAVVIAGFSPELVLGVILGIGILALIHRLLRRVLRDLILVPAAHSSRTEE